MDKDKDMHNQKPEKNNLLMALSIAGVVSSIISLIVAFAIVVRSSQIEYYGVSNIDWIFIIGTASLIFFSVSIAVNALALAKYREYRMNVKKNNTSAHRSFIYLPIIGLILSLLSIVSIPLSFKNLEDGAARREEKERIKKEDEEEQQRAKEYEPVYTSKMHYLECFSYIEDADYRMARDAICGYIKFAYANNWRTPESGTELIKSNYAPAYLYWLSYENNDVFEPSVTVNDSTQRSALQGGFLRSRMNIVPYLTCDKQENDMTISIWFMTERHSQKDNYEEMECMSYDYRDDAPYVDAKQYEKYENATYKIASPDYQEFYEKTIRRLYKEYLQGRFFDYRIPVQSTNGGLLYYNNSDYMETFFSSFPESVLQ